MSERESRGIGTGSAAALVTANMIGAGVFTTSGFALADLQSRGLVLAAWLVAGLVALCGALSYAQLAARMPGNGGEYLFLSRTFHPAIGFLAGWVSLLAGFTAPIAVAAHGLEAYLHESFMIAAPAGLLGAGAILLAGLVHGVRRGPGLVVQNSAVVIKLVGIVVFIALGTWKLDWLHISSLAPPSATMAAPSFGAFAVTLVWISFAYSGWNAAVYVAAELRQPERTLPRASLGATLGVMALYLALNAVFLYAAPYEMLAGRADIGAVAAEAIGGAGARRALSGIVALGLLTSISAMVMVGPRVYAQMAEDGVLPPAFKFGHGTPSRAIALQIALALAAFWLSGLRELLSYVGFLLGLSASATVLCLFFSRGEDARSPHRWTDHPLLPVVFIAVTLGSSCFLVVRQPREAAAGLVTLAVGGLLYAISSRRA